MKPIFLKALIAFLLFSGHYLARADNKTPYGAFSLLSFRPTAARAGDTVMITGTGFTGISSVSFGGVPADSFVVTSPTTIRAYVGSGASGNIVVNAGAALDSLSGFIFVVPPIINSFNPVSAGTGAIITIYGQNFGTTNAVTIGGVPAANFTIYSDSVLWVTIGSGASGNISVSTPYGSASIGGFVFSNSPAPVILSFTPDSAVSRQIVIIKGRKFTNATAVRFGSLDAYAYTVNSDTMITAFVGDGFSGDVSVTTSYGRDSLPGFYFIPFRYPVKLLSFTPDSAKAGDVVLIRGINLSNVVDVRFGGTQAAVFNALSDSLIRAVVGTGSSGKLWVNTGWEGMDSLPGFTYVYLGPAPMVISFTPDTGRQGTAVRISGTHFTNATSVSFGGSPADAFTVVSDSVINAVVGFGYSGPVDVANADGDGSLVGFNYHFPPPPPIAGFSITQFYGSIVQGHAVINWQTANEIAISNFIVQRAPDSVSFVPVDSLLPADNWGTNNYSVTDSLLKNGVYN
ncbi:MAG: IPT/TIG domain-containing protein, partial [Bacteroidota bacterium]|nr:IPT/TIG domain-containing protein [Bacteroidota bacterium]